MPPLSLTAFEHQRLAITEAGPQLGITPVESAHLMAVAELRPGFCERGFDHVKLAEYCGLVSMGDRVLEILPKTEAATTTDHCRGMLVRLLDQAAEVPIFVDSRVGYGAIQAPLLEVFIGAFLDVVAQIVRGGLLVQYKERDDDLPVLRGAIQFAQQLTRNSNRVDRIACRYDDLTANNRWNQLLRFGLWSVRPLIQSSVLYGRWIELAAAFDQVSEQPFTLSSLGSLSFTRQAARYRPAIDWIRLFLQLLSPDLRVGATFAPAILFDMNQLFERAVANSMVRRAPRDTHIVRQEPERMLTAVAGRPDQWVGRVRPDLVVRQNGKVVAIGDTKWKRLSVGRSGVLAPKEDDIYQVLAYAAAYRCENVALIYPWHSGLIGSAETMLEIPGLGELRPVISIICLDLHGPLPTAVRGGNSPVWSPLIVGAHAA